MNSILKHLSAISLTLLFSLGQGFSAELVIGFGSCLDQDQPQPIWKEIKAQNPEVFIMLGDNVYGDTNGNINNLERAYQKQAKAFKKAGLDFPFLAIWDDHDYGKNDGGVEYRLKDESQKLFLNYVRSSPMGMAFASFEERSGFKDIRDFNPATGKRSWLGALG